MIHMIMINRCQVITFIIVLNYISIISIDDSLSSKFSQFINEQGLLDDDRSLPSHLLSPLNVITSQMNALQRNDYPNVDSGIKTAYNFTKSKECEKLPIPYNQVSCHLKNEHLLKKIIFKFKGCEIKCKELV